MREKPTVAREGITPPMVKNNIYIVKQNRETTSIQKKTNKNPSEINKTKVHHWMNQGLLKELKHKTQ